MPICRREFSVMVGVLLDYYLKHFSNRQTDRGFAGETPQRTEEPPHSHQRSDAETIKVFSALTGGSRPYPRLNLMNGSVVG
jgi:hypothetical protein